MQPDNQIRDRPDAPKDPADVYDEGFWAGVAAAETAIGLYATKHIIEPNPYRKTSENG